MKCTISLLTLWVALLAIGCQSLLTNQTQVQIYGKPDERGHYAPVTAKDRAAVKEIVTALATQWRLEDRTSTSFIPTAIASFSQDWNVTAYPMNLIAWEQQGKIIVDLTQRSTGVGETALFRDRQNQLISALQQKFGERAKLPKLGEYVRHLSTGVPLQQK